MNCEQRRDLMPLLLVDGLEPAEAAALRAHLATGCPRCAAYLAEADAMLSYLPFALAPVAPAPEARQKLFDRIGLPEPTPALPLPASAQSPQPHQHAERRHARMPAWARILVPTLAAACITFVATSMFMLDSMRKQRQDLLSALSGKEQIVRTLTTKAQFAEIVKSPGLRLVNMEGRGQPHASGRLVWDDRRQAWHFYAKKLEKLSRREAYELWFVTPYGRKVPGALFNVDDNGDAYLVASVAPEVGPVSEVMVTDEPHVGTFAPTGTVHLYGKLE